MTIKKIVTELCKREGKKKQIDVAQMSETVGHLSDMVFENVNKYGGNPEDFKTATDFIDVVLYNNGFKRSKRKKKK